MHIYLFLKEFNKKLGKNDRNNFLNSFFPFKLELILSNNTSRHMGISSLYIANIIWIIIFYEVWIDRINFYCFFCIYSYFLINDTNKHSLYTIAFLLFHLNIS